MARRIVHPVIRGGGGEDLAVLGAQRAEAGRAEGRDDLDLARPHAGLAFVRERRLARAAHHGVVHRLPGPGAGRRPGWSGRRLKGAPGLDCGRNSTLEPIGPLRASARAPRAVGRQFGPRFYLPKPARLTKLGDPSNVASGRSRKAAAAACTHLDPSQLLWQ